MKLSGVEEKARSYYNSDDAEEFYSRVWGGKDIHIGLYTSENESIADASHRTVETMAALLPEKARDTSVFKALDLGAGYGGAARYLAETRQCEVDCLNLSEAQNERNRQLTHEAGLDSKVRVFDGSFEDIPFDDSQYDLVWSQDSFLHSGRRERVLSEATRVLKKGGLFIFTVVMQTAAVNPGVLQPILNRIHLQSLASPSFYRDCSDKTGLKLISFKDQTEQLCKHYSRVLAEIQKRENELSNTISLEYLKNMQTGLQHWVNGGKSGDICWGIWQFEKL